ncbi:hypothetical protein HAX54_030442, partial [Datura stramonium]|nr:hypothetical protein [Datura stramonium]
SDLDVVFIGEETAINIGSGLGSRSNVGLNATYEVFSITSSMCSTIEKSKEFTNSTESEFEASSDENNDDPKDKNYR